MHEIRPDWNAVARWTWCAVLVLCAARAGAQAITPVPARGSLSVEGPEQCATRAAIVARVAQRSRRIELVEQAPLALRAVVRMSTQRLVSAELHVAWPDGRRALRSLNAPSCAEAIDALALLITLTLDPSAALAPAGGDQTSVSAASAPVTVAEPPAAEPRPSPESAPFALAHVAIGLAGHGVLGVAPRAMPGVAASAAIVLEGYGFWTPVLQVRLAHAWVTTTQAAGTADFQLDSAQVIGCFAGVRTETLAMRACATCGLGRLRARGRDAYDPNSHARLWLSAGGELLLSVELFGPLELQVGAGIALPLRRDRFAFAPQVFHRVAAVVPYGQLGLALRFP